jgi:hypothetical protein
MASDSIPLNAGETREDGPGGKLVLIRYDVFDPRDIHEMQPRDAYSVYDGVSGALLMHTGRFGHFACTATFATDGCLSMTIGRLQLRIDPDARTWAIDHDGWVPHPLNDDLAATEAVIGQVLGALHPPPSHAVEKPTTDSRLGLRLQALLFVCMIVVAGWLLATQGWKPHLRPKQAEPNTVNAWLVTCPDMPSLMVFKINPDGTLSAPPEISRISLPATDGGENRFGINGLTISFEGREVVIKRGGDAIRCGPPPPTR